MQRTPLQPAAPMVSFLQSLPRMFGSPEIQPILNVRTRISHFNTHRLHGTASVHRLLAHEAEATLGKSTSSFPSLHCRLDG